MHLKTIKLRGFKSFVDPVEVRLEPGVAVVVGPERLGEVEHLRRDPLGDGIAEPARAARREARRRALRRGRRAASPSDFCEVELIFDNEDGAWPDLPFAEVSLARRLHRGGEGQYLVNRAAVRRLDLIELLSDVGLGGGLRSIISQGSVETVLGAKPAERRSLVEEAAGLGRFKLRRHRAELKLARVAIQVERARDLEDEVQEASAAARAPGDRRRARGEARRRDRTGGGRDRLARSRPPRRASATAEKQRATELAARKELDAKLETLLAARAKAEEELTDAAGGRERATATLYELKAGTERIAMRREAAESFAARLRAELASIPSDAERARPMGPTPAQLARAADEAERLRDDLTARVELTRERLGALEQSLAEREGLPPAARELAESGERLALSLLDVDSGSERAVAAALGHRASAVLADNPARALELVQRVRAAGLGSRRRPRRPRSARARRGAGGRPDRRAARLRRAGRDRRGHRLGSRPRRALVRG